MKKENAKIIVAAYFIRNVHKIVIDRSALRAMIAVQKIGLAMGKIF